MVVDAVVASSIVVVAIVSFFVHPPVLVDSVPVTPVVTVRPHCVPAVVSPCSRMNLSTVSNSFSVEMRHLVIVV